MRADLEEATTVIRRNADAPSRARSALLDILGTDSHSDDAILLTSELVTNVVRHAPHDVEEMSLGVSTDPVLTISVTQAGGFPKDLAPTETLGGMGLQIVDAVSSTWGFSTDGRTLVMWFQLDD